VDLFNSQITGGTNNLSSIKASEVVQEVVKPVTEEKKQSFSQMTMNDIAANVQSANRSYNA
jgi:hypothetical protein